jgi:hypothetical protein
MQPYLTRQEAANYLRLSIRSLDRLGLPRSYAGSKPLYDRQDLDDALKATRVIPAPSPAPVGRMSARSKVRRAAPRVTASGSDWLRDVMSPLSS